MSESLRDHISFVKQQQEFHAARANSFGTQSGRGKKHWETAEKSRQLIDFLKEQQKEIDELRANKGLVKPKQLRLSLTPNDVRDIPEELKNELSISSADNAEFAVIEILEDRGGIASLDQVILDFYKKTGEIVKRSAMTNRMYRMAQKRLICSVPKFKGVYSLEELAPEDVERLLEPREEGSIDISESTTGQETLK